MTTAPARSGAFSPEILARQKMKGIFLAVLAVLTVSGLALQLSKESATQGAPVIYLIGSPGTEAQEANRDFQAWLRRMGIPEVDLRIDAGSSDQSKAIIQGISGIGADLMPSNLGPNLRYLQAMGLTRDLTDAAKRGGFGPETFAPAARDETVIDGRQFAYPTLLYVLMNYANLDTFAELGLEPPPARPSFEQFESIGREFVKRANPPGQKQRRFFCSGVTPLPMYRSLGLDTFNETLTKCTLDDPRYARVLDLIHRWTYEDRLVPSATDMASFSSDGSTASSFGPRLYQFSKGTIGIIDGGSYLTNSLRHLGAIRLAVLEPPNGGFPNAVFGASMLAVYAGSKHPEAAGQYLRYLASPEYAERVIKTGSGIPANLSFARRAEFLRPPDYPNEWGCNESFVNAIEKIGIPYTSNPFVLYAIYSRIAENANGQFMAGLCSAQQAGQRAARDINEEIARTLQNQPDLAPRYEKLAALQKEIDARRARGEKVPLAWISNPFHQQYYKFMGWAE